MKFQLPSNLAQYISADGRPLPDFYRWLKQIDPNASGGSGLPTGGTTRQVLEKASATDGDAIWHTLVKADVGLGNVDNTSDANKPVSTATQTALNAKANTADLGTAAAADTGDFDAAGTATAAIASHVAAADPHPQYLTATEGNAAYQPLDGDLTAIAALTSTGVARRTAANTWSAGSLVSYSEIQNVANNRVLGNVSGTAAPPSEMTGAQVAGLFTKFTRQIFTSGSGTYTTPSGARYIRVTLVGGGGGGSGSGTATSGNSGGAGGNTTFGTLSGNGGGGGIHASNGGVGGATSGTSSMAVKQAGGAGGGPALVAAYSGSQGGGTRYGIVVTAGPNSLGGSGTSGTGQGGGGAGTNSTTPTGSGGGGGGWIEDWFMTPAATYSYAVGAGGSNGAAGTGGQAGGAGGSGIIIIDEFYS